MLLSAPFNQWIFPHADYIQDHLFDYLDNRRRIFGGLPLNHCHAA